MFHYSLGFGLLYDLTVVLSICFNQFSRVYLLAFKCSCCNKDCQIPKRVYVVVYVDIDTFININLHYTMRYQRSDLHLAFILLNLLTLPLFH